MFLGQSLRSDYCAIYATAMALTLAGHPTNRRQAFKLFKAGPGWSGASHAEISSVLRRRMRSFRRRWRHSLCDNPVSAAATLYAAAVGDEPLLVTAYCRHRSLDLVCGHAFLVVGCDDGGLWLLDSLSRRPTDGAKTNARILLEQSLDGSLLRIDGSPWDVCVDKPFSTISVKSGGRTVQLLPSRPIPLAAEVGPSTRRSRSLA